jgi:threonyl-tRNA synthetase
MQKTPFMMVIGDREIDAGQVAPRQRDGKNLEAMTPEAFALLVQEQCSQFL